ncbi:MAG: site-specific integrase [Owenweeksia sp.]|nr:site-specific integrase [Owenweeksia sp.]
MLLHDFSFYLFLRKSKKLEDGSSPIYLRISHNGIRKDIGTRLSAPTESWDAQFKRVRGSSREIKDTNAQLKQWEERIADSIRELHWEREYFTLEDLISRTNNEKKTTGLLEFYQDRMAELKKRIEVDFSPNTYKVYKSTFNHLEYFLQKRLKRKDYPIKGVDYNFLDQFFWYLRIQCKIGQNSANKYLKTLKAVLNDARKRQVILHNAFENFQIKAGEYDRTYLTTSELEAIIDYEPADPKIGLAKEYFLFVCFTGFHYSDVKSLRQSHFRKEGDKEWILKPRDKNNQSSVVPLLPMAQRILEKHAGYELSDGKMLKMYSNQKTNQYLKELATACTIDKNLSCKVGRHTFATTVTLTNKVPIESVSRMLGHTSIKTTQIYAQVVHQKVLGDMEGVALKYS